MAKRKRNWTFSAGERPHTVTIFERDGNLHAVPGTQQDVEGGEIGSGAPLNTTTEPRRKPTPATRRRSSKKGLLTSRRAL